MGAVVSVGAVDIFVIVELLDPGNLIGGVFHDGQCHIGLERHQLAVGIGKGDDVIRQKKALIAHVKVVFFKLTHFILSIA